MILYNTLMGVLAGLGLIFTAQLVKMVFAGTGIRGKTGGYAAALLTLGIPLTFLSGLMATTWPLTANPPINIAFAEPCLMLGILMTVAGAVLWKLSAAGSGVQFEAAPTAWIVFALGLMLATIASAIFSYNLVGDAPPQEPITGQFTGWENTAFGLTYLAAALGCLLVPWVGNVNKFKRTVTFIVYWAWTLSGVAFLLFSILNYRTHIGLILNLETGTNYKW